MATEHGGRTTSLPGGGRLEAVVTDALRRFTGETNADGGAARPDATNVEGNRTGSRKDTETEQLLTPEERIVEALERNGGTMKQAEIVATVRWSESTVSRKLSDLESREALSRYQIGREKLVYLPGHEPEAVESPLARVGAD